jgi:hypothetical protein
MNNVLVAATHGRGMFSINVSGTGLPPVVSLTSPANGATFAAPANVSLAATASDPDGSVVSVEFFAGGASVGTDTTSPYTATWGNAAAGSYALTARATDNAGNTTTSLPVNVTVTGGVVPANNNFAAAQVLNGNAGTVTGGNAGANKEAGEPNHAGNVGGASVWYLWQAPASGTTTVHTAGSNFNTTLAVYTGTSVAGLTAVASNDNDTAASLLTSRLTFAAVGGTTYRIAVDGNNGATGNISLGWSLAPSCSYSVSPTSQSFAAGGGAGSVGVTAGAGCNWTATSNSSFLTITSGASGSGPGSVGYAVAANTTASARTGTLTVAGQTFTVTQAAGGGCPTAPISVGLTINGALAATDCRFTNGSYVDLYTFNGTAGQQVAVTMTGGFDTYLILFAPDNSILVENDDGGGGTNSRIPAVSGSLTLPVSGAYTIAASSFNANATGPYALTLTGTTPASSVQFSAAAFAAGEGGNSAIITVTRTGSTAGSATVAYATMDNPAAIRCDVANGTAYARCDYATTLDTLQFAAGQSQLTFAVPLINDAHVEGPEILTLRLTTPTGATLGAQATATLTLLDDDATAGPNPVDASPFFVRLQYLDFLSREPDAGGFDAWLGVLNNCPNVFNTDPHAPSAGCDRTLVSSAFFRSTEFQLKGLYTYLFYKVSFGRLPEYAEITPDMRSVSGQTQAEVYAKRAAFADAWTQRAAFRAAYDGMTNGAYVDALLNRYGLSQITTPDPANPEGTAQVVLTRADLTNRLNAGTLTRPQALRAVVQSREVDAREYNGAFVAMQYYGYLRRTPEQPGYQNWLNLINANPTDSRTMINGFLNSVEYRLRFGAQ